MIDRIDHLVLTARSVEASCTFYERVLGFAAETRDDKPTSLHFGQHKINLHQVDRTFDPKALCPTPGAGDFCLVTKMPIEAFAAHLTDCGVPIEKGPIERTGATGLMLSVYFRDPDGNLVEVSQYH